MNKIKAVRNNNKKVKRASERARFLFTVSRLVNTEESFQIHQKERGIKSEFFI